LFLIIHIIRKIKDTGIQWNSCALVFQKRKYEEGFTAFPSNNLLMAFSLDLNLGKYEEGLSFMEDKT